MNPDSSIDLLREALQLGLLVAAPLLAVSLLVGLVVGVLQTITQVQEQTLSFVPKLVAMAIAALVMLPWSIDRIVEYSATLYREIPPGF